MPYVKQEFRDDLDPAIEWLALEIAHCYTNSSTQTRDGLLNYAFTRILSKVYDTPNYHEFNEIIGMLSCCQMEYYRKRTAPYEDAKEIENGSV